MQELAPHIFIETAYPGVTLGAINFPHGLIMIDAPLRPDDIRLWRATLFNIGTKGIAACALRRNGRAILS